MAMVITGFVIADPDYPAPAVQGNLRLGSTTIREDDKTIVGILVGIVDRPLE